MNSLQKIIRIVNKHESYTIKILAILSVIYIIVGMYLPINTVIAAEQAPRKIKVGFYQMSGYHHMDTNGIKSGYGYELLSMTQRYANLNYEYVGYYANWNEMFEMLREGKIDLLTSVEKTPEREKEFEFSAPIGSTSLRINVLSENNNFVAEDFHTYNGMKLGLLKGSVSNSKVAAYAREHGFVYTPYYFSNVDDLTEALKLGTIDAVASTSLRKTTNEKTISEFNIDYIYAICRKNDKDIINRFNYALKQMDVSEGEWKTKLYDKNYRNFNKHEIIFSEDEKAFIDELKANKRKIVVAVDDSWEPFSKRDGIEFSGIAIDFCNFVMQNSGLDHEYYLSDKIVSNESVLNDKDVDLYFCYSYDENISDISNYNISPEILKLGTSYVMLKDCRQVKTVGLCGNVPMLNLTLQKELQVPLKKYTNIEAGLEGVRSGAVDAIALYSHEAEWLINNDNTGLYKTTVIPNVSMSFRAVQRAEDNHILMSIISKGILTIDDSTKDVIISRNISYTLTKSTLKDFILLHSGMVISVALIIIGLFVAALVLFMDKNAKMQLEEERAKRADAANEAKTSFLFKMSHDLRTPMNAIIGFADLLEKNQGDPVKRSNYLNKIKKASNVLLSIINNVLNMARIEKGTIAINESAWSAEQFNDTIYSILHDMMKEKKINLSRNIDVVHPYIYCDYIKMQEVFINILSNALKYTEPGGSVHMEVKEIPCNKPGYALYQTTISDTGIGMSASFLPHLFEEFSREHTSTESKVEGTGLGMPIVKRLVEIMDGTINVSSELGVGTTFVVTLPHRIAEKSDLTQLAQEYKEDVSFEGVRILLAEDNDLNAEIAQTILTETGFVVERAEDGMVCVDMLKDRPDDYYGVILMDIQMPRMNGYDTTKTIRKLENKVKANIPILAMTANAFEEDKQDAINVGMNGHLSKPVVVSDLLAELSRVLKN